MWAIVLLGVVGYGLWLNDPLIDSFDFIIGGIVPGTNTVLGFWPFIGLLLIVLWLLWRGLERTRLQMLENTARQIKAEKAQRAFHEQHSSQSEKPRNRAVIASTSSELI